VESGGATEGAPAAGAAELVVDITTTGATLEANNLKVISDGVILKSEAQLAAGLKAPWTREQVDVVRFFLRTVEARARAKQLATLAWSEGQAGKSVETLTPMKSLFDAANALADKGIGPASASRPDYVFEPECVAADTLSARLAFPPPETRCFLTGLYKTFQLNAVYLPNLSVSSPAVVDTVRDLPFSQLARRRRPEEPRNAGVSGRKRPTNPSGSTAV